MLVSLGKVPRSFVLFYEPLRSRVQACRRCGSEVSGFRGEAQDGDRGRSLSKAPVGCRHGEAPTTRNEEDRGFEGGMRLRRSSRGFEEV